jgi:hypothetical protein
MMLTSFESGALVFTGVHRKRMPSARNDSRLQEMIPVQSLCVPFKTCERHSFFMGALKSLFGAFKN